MHGITPHWLRFQMNVYHLIRNATKFGTMNDFFYILLYD